MRAQPVERVAAPDAGRALPRVRAGLCSVLLAACLTGCAGGGGSGGGDSETAGDGSSQVSGDTETFTSPDTEPTTPETGGGSSTNDNLAISVARLPIGGDSQDDGTDARLQCAHVTWIASDDGQIPRGTGVEITGVVFDPAVFQAVGSGCGSERPSCLHYVFRTSTLQCDLAVRATGEVPQDANPSLGFSGLVFCPDNDSDTCRRFVAALGDEQQLSVSLNVPQLPPEPTEGPEPTDSATTDSSTDSTSTTATDTATTDGG